MSNSTQNKRQIALALIKALADFIASGVAAPEMISAAKNSEALVLRLISIALISWLKSRARVPEMTGMHASEAGSAKADLLRLVANDSFFSQVFIIVDEKVKLYQEASAEDVSEIVRLAHELYNPPRFATVRRNQIQE